MVAPSIPVLTELGDSHNAHNTQGQPSPSLCINRDKNQYADAQIDQSDQSDRPQPDDNDTLDQPTPRTPPSHESQSQAERESQSETQPTCLEDRVLDLESKLATLSRLLTQSMKRDSPLGVSNRACSTCMFNVHVQCMSQTCNTCKRLACNCVSLPLPLDASQLNYAYLVTT